MKTQIIVLGALPAFVASFTGLLTISSRRDSSTAFVRLQAEKHEDTLAAFPKSTRAALLDKAKSLDEELAKGKATGSYAPSGWSNRVGTALTPASIPGVYTADRPFYWNKIDVGGRMTVIKLENGDLWIHSPVALDESLRASLDQLGTVKYVISPNYEHVKYAAQWYEAYPNAFRWGCPGLSERMPEIQWEGEIPSHILRPGSNVEAVHKLKHCWDFGTIVPLHLDMEINPFTGKPFFNEVLFYHAPSKSMLTTDLYWNYPNADGVPNSHLGSGGAWDLAPAVDSVPFGTKLWKKGMDKIYLPFFKKLMVKDRSRYNEMVKIVLDEWDIETLIPAHGDIIRGKALIRSVLQEHLQL